MEKSPYTQDLENIIKKYKERNPDVYEILKEDQRILNLYYIVIRQENLKVCPIVGKWLQKVIPKTEPREIPRIKRNSK